MNANGLMPPQPSQPSTLEVRLRELLGRLVFENVALTTERDDLRAELATLKMKAAPTEARRD